MNIQNYIAAHRQLENLFSTIDKRLTRLQKISAESIALTDEKIVLTKLHSEAKANGNTQEAEKLFEQIKVKQLDIDMLQGQESGVQCDIVELQNRLNDQSATLATIREQVISPRIDDALEAQAAVLQRELRKVIHLSAINRKPIHGQAGLLELIKASNILPPESDFNLSIAQVDSLTNDFLAALQESEQAELVA